METTTNKLLRVIARTLLLPIVGSISFAVFTVLNLLNVGVRSYESGFIEPEVILFTTLAVFLAGVVIVVNITSSPKLSLEEIEAAQA